MKGAIHSTKISGLKFEKFMLTNGSRQVGTVWFHSTRKANFALNLEVAETLLLVLELDDNLDGDINDIV